LRLFGAELGMAEGHFIAGLDFPIFAIKVVLRMYAFHQSHVFFVAFDFGRRVGSEFDRFRAGSEDCAPCWDEAWAERDSSFFVPELEALDFRLDREAEDQNAPQSIDVFLSWE
jgi:hypothetical protein